MGTYKDEYVFDFFKADQEEIEKKIRGLSKKIIELIAESDFQELGKLLQECKAMRYIAQGYLEETEENAEEKRVLVNIGYTRALLDVMQMYLQKLTIQNEIQQIHTKYRDEILTILAKSGTLLHKDLASAAGVSISGLTAIIKQMNATSVKMIHVEEISKFKLYSITPVAYKYVMQNMPELSIDLEIGTNRKEQYFNYIMEMSKIIKNKREAASENEYSDKIKVIRQCEKMMKKEIDLGEEHSEKIRFIKPYDKEKKRYSERRPDFGNLVAFG